MSGAEFYHWIAQHPHWAGWAVFLIAMAESLAVIGMLVPGVAMMFAAGALIGAGALAFEPVCAYAVAGAVAGDGVSFWLGWRYRERLRKLWPFSRHPGMLDRGVAFFRRHGGLSVLLGRFVGPIRAVIPLVAGMLAMPVPRFLIINVLSALLWGPLYLLPGMAFGASLELASQVAGRLAALLVALVAVLWGTVWLSKHLYAYFRPRAHGLILRTFDLCKVHPRFGRLALPLLDPTQPDYPGLLAWALLLGGGAVGAGWLVPGDRMPVSLAAWRHPWADYGLTVCAELGASPAVLAFCAGIGGWLWHRGQRLAALHGLIGVGFAATLGALTGGLQRAPLVDGPVLNGIAAYGFAAVLVADRWRGPVYGAAALLVVLIAFGRLYTGAGDFLALGFTLGLGALWLVLVGVAYRRHRAPGTPSDGLVVVAPLALMAIAAALAASHGPEDFAYRPAPVAIRTADWLAGGWSALPAHRLQTFGRPDQALSVQWAAPLAEIRAWLIGAGWREPRAPSPSALLGTLRPDTGIAALPVLPHFNQSEADVLRLIRPTTEGRWLIVRFWPSGLRLAEGDVPVWLGSVAFLEARQILGLVRFSEEQVGDPQAWDLLVAQLATRAGVMVQSGPEGRQALLVLPGKPP